MSATGPATAGELVASPRPIVVAGMPDARRSREERERLAADGGERGVHGGGLVVTPATGPVAEAADAEPEGGLTVGAK